jgi:hypothetical protein
VSRMVAFRANDEEAAELEVYCKDHHYRSIPDFARHALFAYIRKNKPGAHRTKKDTPRQPEAGRTTAPLT